jgi:uncharacterized protein
MLLSGFNQLAFAFCQPAMTQSMEYWKRLGQIFVLVILGLTACSQKAPSVRDPGTYPLAKRAMELQKSADAGDAGSLEALGWMHLNGMGVAVDEARAAALFKKSADLGNARAQRHMGHLYLYGGGVSRDFEVSAQWFKRAIAGGEGWGYVGLIDVRRRLEGNIPIGESLELLDKAVEKLLPLSDARSAIALYTIAKRRELGSMEKDPAMVRALEVLRKAADAGDADAQRTLGEIFRAGHGVVPNTETAVTWYEKSAAQGDAPSQVVLGEIYLKGQDLIRENVERARYWYERAAALNHVAALYQLGQIYGEGIGVPKQSAVAAQWYQRAAALRHSAAQNNLGVMYTEGDGVPKDAVLAYAWFNLAAADGLAVAKENRDGVELSASEREVAQILSAGWKIGQVLKR